MSVEEKYNWFIFKIAAQIIINVIKNKTLRINHYFEHFIGMCIYGQYKCVI